MEEIELEVVCDSRTPASILGIIRHYTKDLQRVLCMCGAHPSQS